MVEELPKPGFAVLRFRRTASALRSAESSSAVCVEAGHDRARGLRSCRVQDQSSFFDQWVFSCSDRATALQIGVARWKILPVVVLRFQPLQLCSQCIVR